MATVYLAMQQSLERQIALKTLRVDPLLDDEDPQETIFDDDLQGEQRFINEAKLVAAVKHPHVIQIYDVGAAEGLMYLSMEYLSGGDLQARMGVEFDPIDALTVLARVGTALAAAHAKGIVHRDVKPANILFREDDTPILSDFGIAKDVDNDLSLTTTGRVLGSPFYISPEQAEGGSFDGRTDLYALGIIFYEMLTGERPYDGNSAIKVILQHLQAPVPRLQGDLQVLQPLLERMMAKSPEHRFPDAATLVKETVEAARLWREALAGKVCTDEVDDDEAAEQRREAQARARFNSASLVEVIDKFRAGIMEDLEDDRIVLPSLPDSVLRVRKELEQGESTAHRVARIVASDPALSAQLLRVANSAFYGGHEPVSDLQRAVVRLGNNAISQIVMMLVVAQLYNSRNRPSIEPHLRATWRHSLVVASIAERLAKQARIVDSDTALLAGLIHAIGALPILVWAEQIPHVVGDELSLRAILEGLHPEMGFAILKRWRYPDELVRVPLEYANFERRTEHGNADLTDIVTLANVLARQGTGHPHGAMDPYSLDAFERLHLNPATVDQCRDEGIAVCNELGIALVNP
jgi:serine/threonine protein kinase